MTLPTIKQREEEIAWLCDATGPRGTDEPGHRLIARLRLQLTAAVAARDVALGRAAMYRRQAATKQARASYLCNECRGPDGEHAGECRYA